MARNRMIRPEFWEDTKIAKLSMTSRLLFIALWNFADDEGYLTSEKEWIKAKCFPYDGLKIEIYIKELEDAERIEIKNGIIHIKNFLKYQRISHPYPSEQKRLFTEHSLNVPECSPLREDKIREVNIREYKETMSDSGASPQPPKLQSFLDFETKTIEIWNRFCEKYPRIAKVSKLSHTRRAKLKERFGDKDFVRAFESLDIYESIEKQPFLINGDPSSKEHSDWRISFDWLIRNDTNYLKVIELKYMKDRR